MFRWIKCPLTKNPFICAINLNHPALLDEAQNYARAIEICREIGDVDIVRICVASKVILDEEKQFIPQPKR